MKLLREIAQKNNAIHASIHNDNGVVNDDVDNVGNDAYYPDSLESLGESVEDSIKRQTLHSSLVKHYSNFTPRHKVELGEYTDESSDLNAYHWGKHRNPMMHQEEHEFSTSHIDSALKQHKTPYDLTVHSGIAYDPREKMNSEHIVHHPAYLSASINPKVAKGFSRMNSQSDANEIKHAHVLKIDVPKGHSGAYVSHISNVKKEREFILPRGINLQHVGHTESKPEKYSFGKMIIHHIHHMKVVE
jgi:hypothetical protein